MIDPFPDVVRVEPAGFCNFSCKHCIVGRQGGKRGLLNYDDFVRLMMRLPSTPRVLVLYHGGEPMLNPDLEKMIAYAKAIGVCYVVFNTNASQICDSTDLHLLDELRVSFDGKSAQENDKIRLGGMFHIEKLKIRQLSRDGQKRPRQITIYNISDGRVPDYLLDAFAGYPVVFRADKRKEWPDLQGDAVLNADIDYCPNLWETFTVLANGRVVMCCEDLLGQDTFGNAFEEQPLKIWARMQIVRDAFKDGDYHPLCRRCWRLR